MDGSRAIAKLILQREGGEKGPKLQRFVLTMLDGMVDVR